LPSFINEKKTPIEKGEKGGTRREDQHSKKGEHPRVQNGIPREQRRATKLYVLNLSLVMRSK